MKRRKLIISSIIITFIFHFNLTDSKQLYYIIKQEKKQFFQRKNYFFLSVLFDFEYIYFTTFIKKKDC